MTRVFTQGLKKVIGFALPLRRGSSGWESGPWFLKDDTLWLIPGDSPMGYRLPLDSQPWVAKGDYPYVHAMDPMQPRPGLPASRAPIRMLRPGESPGSLADAEATAAALSKARPGTSAAGPGSPVAVGPGGNPAGRTPGGVGAA